MTNENGRYWNVEELDLIEKSKNQSTQILVEGDSIVPEHKPDLSKILHYRGEINEKSVKVSDNQFNYIGEMVVDILYHSNNGTYGVYSMRSILPINETIYVDGLKDEESVNIKAQCSLVHLESAIVNDRKVSVRGVGELNFCVENSKKQKIILPIKKLDIDDDETRMEFLETSVGMECMVDEKRDVYKIKDEYMIDDKMPSVGEILRVRSKIVDKEVRPMEDKAMFHSNIIVDTLYRDSEGLCHVSRNKVPFNGHIDSKKCTPKSVVEIDFCISQCKVDVVINDYGEARILDIELGVEGCMQVFENKECKVVTDAYIPNKKTEIEKEEFSYVVVVGGLDNQFHIREKVVFEDSRQPMMQVENTWGDVMIENISVVDGVIEINGVIDSEIMYLSGEDNSPMQIVEERVPFMQRVEVDGIRENDDIYVQGNVEEVDFQIYSGKEGELISRVILKIVVKRNKVGVAVVDIEIGEMESNEKRGAGAVIYTVQGDDSLWEIAKTHNTTVAEVMGMNGIDEVREGESVLIFRS